MARLTNNDYLENRWWLTQLWLDSVGSFVELSSRNSGTCTPTSASPEACLIAMPSNIGRQSPATARHSPSRLAGH